MTSSTSPESIRAIFLRVAPKSFFEDLCKRYSLDRNAGIYTTDVVCWLMIQQWVSKHRTLSTAVQSLIEQHSNWVGDCKRVQQDQISSRTGGYSTARKNLPKQIALDMTDRLSQQLRVLMQEGWKGINRPVFIVDGTTLQLRHRPSILKEYPAGSNQHGDNHWPMMQVVTFHDVFSGVALRPNWGPMYGDSAVSEQALARQMLDRLPPEAVVLGDINFGIFSFAWAVHQSGRPMVLRIQLSRVRRMLGKEPVVGMDEPIRWEPRDEDRKKYPWLPKQAQLDGRLLVFPHPGKTDELVCVFTGLALPAQEVFDIYGLRWNIEQDIRTLKRTMGLHQLTSQSVEMVEKELLMAYSGYNLVRAAMCLAARQVGLEPRRLSFSQTQDVVQVALPGLQQAQTEEEFQHKLDRMLRRVAQCTLPKRPKRRSYPRVVWGQGEKFPRHRRSPDRLSES